MGSVLSQLFHEFAPAFTTQRHVDIDTSHPPDFSIVVEEERIPVHRKLLEETCHYFQCLFECRIQEVETGTLEVKHMQVSVVRTVIAYLYGEDISISWDSVTDYLDIVEMWQLIELKDELEDYIVTNIDIDIKFNNCMHWMDIVETYHMAKLERKILNLDACTKLRVCINSIQDGDANSESLYIDLLHHFKLTNCTPKFIEFVLKNEFSDAELARMQQYTSMLSQLCMENTLEIENKEQATFVGISENNRRRIAEERDATSSKSFDEAPEGQNHGCMSQSRRGELSEGYKIITFQRDEMIYILEFNKELSKVCATEVGSHPNNNAYGCNCMTPYGVFSVKSYTLDEESPCILFDISSLNYVCLRVLPSPLLRTHLTAVCVNTTVYVVNPCKTTNDPFILGLDMKYLDLQKPTHWHSEISVPLMRGVYYDACAVGYKIYLISISDYPINMNCYDASIKTWSKCSKYNGWSSWNITVITVGENIFCRNKQSYECFAAYNTICNQWTEFNSPDFRAALGAPDSIDDVCYLGPVSGDDKCLIIASLGKLFVYDMQHKKLVTSFEVPWDKRYRVLKMLMAC